MNEEILALDEQQKNNNKKEKKKKSFGQILISSLISLVVFIFIIFGIVFCFFYFKYDINLITAGKQIGLLYEKVDIDTYADNQFSNDDYLSAQSKLDNFIFTNNAVKFTDREIASLMSNSISKNKGQTETEGIDLVNDFDLKIIQIKFSINSDSENYLTDFNTIVELDFSKFKTEKMDSFPLSLLKNLLFDKLYISSNLIVTKTGESTYAIESNGLKINNLSSENTDIVFNLINKFVNVGSADNFNLMLGDNFVSALICGFYKQFEIYGAEGYSFFEDAGQTYFVAFSESTTKTAQITYNNTKDVLNNNKETYTVLDNKIYLEDLSKDGYNFLGWYDGESDNSNKIDYINAWNLKDISLFAHWDIIKYKIQYFLHGGTVSSENPTEYTVEDSFSLNNPYKSDESPFTGWTGTNIQDKTLSVSIEQGTIGDLEFYAWFDDDERILTLYVDNKQVKLNVNNEQVDECIITIGETMSSSEISNLVDDYGCGMSGYYVKKWFTDSSLQVEYDETVPISGDLKLYGEWTYIVDSLSFYQYISKFKTAVENKKLTVNSYDELKAYIEYLFFYDVKDNVEIELNYSFTRKINDEFISAKDDAVNNTFYSGSTLSFVPKKSNVLNCYISSSMWNEYATLVMDPNKQYVAPQKHNIFVQNSEKTRTEEFDDFKINNVKQTIDVSYSWQLVYCLEQGYKPNCEKDSKAEDIYNKAKDILRDICNDSMTDVEKLKSIYEWLIENVGYDRLALANSEIDDQSLLRKYKSWYVEGVFDDRVAVCAGYANAFIILARIEGIPMVYVTGSAHAWNKVYVDKKWYNIDATHGDEFFEKNNLEIISYRNFLISDEMKKSMGYETSDYSKLVADTDYEYYESTIIENGKIKIDLYAENAISLTNIFSFVKNYAKENDIKDFTFEIEISSEISDITIQTSISSCKFIKTVAGDSYYNDNYCYICICSVA